MTRMICGSVPILLRGHAVKRLELPAKIGGAFKAGFLCDPGDGFFRGGEQLGRLFQAERYQIRNRGLMNPLPEQLQRQTPADMNGCADIL